jgi:CubicO group peptidase (beta-lactamase class C family)
MRHLLIQQTLIVALFGYITVPVLADTSLDKYATAEEMGLMQGFPPPPEKRVDRSSIAAGPGNRWSYLHMRRLYPTAGVPVAEVSVPLKKSDGAIEKLRITQPEAQQAVDVDTWLKETYSDAVVIVQDDRIVFERYLNGMHADQPHQMMSVTKSFAGLFGLLAVADGFVKESDLVTDIIPELQVSTAFSGATFGQVLDMTNSMDFSEDYADPESGIVHFAIVLGLMPPVEGRTYANSIYEYLPTLEIDQAHQHGEVFSYQTPKTDVVNWVNNRVTGKSFQEDLYDRLWSQLGTDGETYVLLDKSGALFAGGGLNATPKDLARFAMMLLRDGKNHSGEQIVPASVIRQLADGGDRRAFQDGPYGDLEDWSYRAQWWVRHTPGKEAIMAIGIHGQWVYIDLERNIAIIKQSSQPTSESDYQDSYNINAFDAIVSHLEN